ncbi:MAG TPA: exostosin family protein [Pyrinomonadaceae bacterium]
METFCSPVTKAYIHSYKPLRLYVYDYQNFPYGTLNVLVKAKVFDDARYSEGRHLFRLVEEPDDADFFVFPCDLNYFENREEQIYEHLHFYDGNESRHVFFDHRDRPEPFPKDNSIRFKASLHQAYVSDVVICIPYVEPVDNFFWYLLARRSIKYQLSFVGSGTPFRERILESLKSIDPSYFKLRKHFFHGGYLQFEGARRMTEEETPSVKRALREEYINISLQSKFVLALRGYGLNSFRFFEALSLGVPPILVSRDCALPYTNLVNYDDICIRIDESDADLVERIKEAVYSTDEDTYLNMCRAGRLYYDGFFSSRNYLYLLYNALRRAD